MSVSIYIGHTAAPEENSWSWKSMILGTYQKSSNACTAVAKKIFPLFYYTNEQIRLDSEDQKDFTILDKIWLGVKAGGTNILMYHITAKITHMLADMALLGIEAVQPTESLHEVMATNSMLVVLCLWAPLLEELVCRGIVQNCLAGAQKALHAYPPTFLHKETTDWLTSPQARILADNTIFAALHLKNASVFGTKFAIGQTISCFLFPTEAGLYETTGSLISPIASHITNNAIITLPLYLLLKLAEANPGLVKIT